MMIFYDILLYFQSFNEFSDCDLNSDKKDHILDQNLGISEFGPALKRGRITPPTSERVMLYVRQENEDVYTPLHVVPPTTIGLLNAVSCYRLIVVLKMFSFFSFLFFFFWNNLTKKRKNVLVKILQKS